MPKRSRFFGGLVSTGLPEGSKRVTKGSPRGGRKRVFFQFGREISIKIERCVFSILRNIDYFVGFMCKSETRVFTFLFVKKTDVL